MNEFYTFFAQAYWWLSLLGGLHCLALAIYIRFFYHADGNQQLLASFLSLIALYFLTGMLNRDNTPIPIHVLFNIINPIYFLLMPLLYLYCKRSLEQRFEPIGFSIHYWPSIFTLFIAVIDVVLRADLQKNPIWIQSEIILHRINIDISHWGILLPLLLSIQTCGYFIALWFLFRRYKQPKQDTLNAPLANLRLIRFRWLFSLTLAMLLNWLIRVFVVVIPFYLGDSLSILSNALPRLSLLLSIYLLAVYGLKQITRTAYLKGHLAAPSTSATTSQPGELLTPEEFNFLQHLQDESNETSDKSVESKHNAKN
ncbi:hypothetical protein L2744_12645 [Shewanella profunda]|uniref:hypothetical protein n=1 Tax=Shewanella profunda TaxID=254793 RepID=UPI00200D9A4F|nr:hypothetical protein [Shewanella profunda]MCL1090425.1 hypothetical protein [Shewanella profunda]